MGGRMASRRLVARAVDDFRAIAGVFQLRLGRPLVRIALCGLYGRANARVHEQVPCAPAACAREQPALTVAGLAAKVAEHRLRVGACQPFRHNHRGCHISILSRRVLTMSVTWTGSTSSEPAAAATAARGPPV